VRGNSASNKKRGDGPKKEITVNAREKPINFEGLKQQESRSIPATAQSTSATTTIIAMAMANFLHRYGMENKATSQRANDTTT